MRKKLEVPALDISIASDEVVTVVQGYLSQWNGPAVIMAGHSRVYWDPGRERLVPILPGLRSEAFFYGMLQPEVLEFCELTWHWGLDLVEASPQSRILLLLDDAYAFRPEVRAYLPHSRSWEQAPTGDRLAHYRGQLYEEGVPEWYLREISGRGLRVEQVLVPNHDPARPMQSILPRKCWLYSEHHLNGKGQRARLAVWAVEQAGGIDTYGLVRSCLTVSPDDCRCLETAGSLLYQMSLHARNAVLFVPPSCAGKVRPAVEQLFLLGAFDAVLCVWGIGDLLLGTDPSATVWYRE